MLEPVNAASPVANRKYHPSHIIRHEVEVVAISLLHDHLVVVLGQGGRVTSEQVTSKVVLLLHVEGEVGVDACEGAWGKDPSVLIGENVDVALARFVTVFVPVFVVTFVACGAPGVLVGLHHVELGAGLTTN